MVNCKVENDPLISPLRRDDHLYEVCWFVPVYLRGQLDGAAAVAAARPDQHPTHNKTFPSQVDHSNLLLYF